MLFDLSVCLSLSAIQSIRRAVSDSVIQAFNQLRLNSLLIQQAGASLGYLVRHSLNQLVCLYLSQSLSRLSQNCADLLPLSTITIPVTIHISLFTHRLLHAVHAALK